MCLALRCGSALAGSHHCAWIPSGYFFVHPVLPTTKRAATTFPKTFVMQFGNKQERYRVATMPLLEALCITGHKAQGCTCHHVILCGLFRGAAASTANTYDDGLVSLIAQKAWLYVAMSWSSTLLTMSSQK